MPEAQIERAFFYKLPDVFVGEQSRSQHQVSRIRVPTPPIHAYDEVESILAGMYQAQEWGKIHSVRIVLYAR